MRDPTIGVAPGVPAAAGSDGANGDGASLGELTKRLTEQVSQLARKEIELAKVELTEKGKRAGIGAGMFGGAGLLAVFGLAVLTACAVLALALVLPSWLAALIVGLVYVAAAGALALLGKREVGQATPVVPEETTASVKEDVQWVKQRARAGRA